MVSIYYIDETGFTGEDLMSADQPIFVQATNNFDKSEADELIAASFDNTQARELKYSRVRRSKNGRKAVVSLVRLLAKTPDRAGTWIAHKEFAMTTHIVEWWMEPLANSYGLNLYEDGANIATANMLFATLGAFWPTSFREKLLLHFQRMFRARTEERFLECRNFIENGRRHANLDQDEILQYLWPSFELLGLPHIQSLPPRALDLALPGLVLIGHSWRNRNPGPWELVHDNSTHMAKQKWLWDALASPNLPNARFDFPSGSQDAQTSATFPMNVTNSHFADSSSSAQLQICDILAGATSDFLRRKMIAGEDDAYLQDLETGGILELILGSIWPSLDVTPEALGRRGWDGSRSIDWIADQLKQKNVRRR